MMVELLAEAEGHEVLFTPPCHSDLQPIELLWAKLKGNIGRKYSTGTTMTVLKQRLDEEFTSAMGWNESIEGFIRKANWKAAEFWAKMQAETADTVEPETDEDSSNDEGGNESDEDGLGDVVGV